MHAFSLGKVFGLRKRHLYGSLVIIKSNSMSHILEGIDNSPPGTTKSVMQGEVGERCVVGNDHFVSFSSAAASFSSNLATRSSRSTLPSSFRTRSNDSRRSSVRFN